VKKRESPALMQTLVGSTQAGWVGLPRGLGSVLCKIGEVLHAFQNEEEEGFGHALITGDFLGT